MSAATPTPTLGQILEGMQNSVAALQAFIAAQTAPPAPAPAPAPTPAPAPAPAPSGTWTTVAQEWASATAHGTFTITAAQAPALCQFGSGTAWLQKTLAAGTYTAELSTFGTVDPAPGVAKEVQLWVPTAAPAPSPAPAPAPAPAGPPSYAAAGAVQPGFVGTPTEGQTITIDFGDTVPASTSYTVATFLNGALQTSVSGLGPATGVVPVPASSAGQVFSVQITPISNGVTGILLTLPGLVVQA